jgi:hypothetical protein
VKGAGLFILGAMCGVAAVAMPKVAPHLRAAVSDAHADENSADAVRAHTRESFTVMVRAPMDQAAPLFGAYKERVWAPEFDAQFVHPLPARDEQGMVFTVAHGQRKAYWVNTEFDLKSGRLRYSYVIPEVMATALFINLTPDGENTRVDVTYERTSLSSEGDTRVDQFSRRDREAGLEWQRQINSYLESVKARVGRQ